MSLAWLKLTQKIPELQTAQELEALLEKEIVILFKHSGACDRSRAAHSEMKTFKADHPGLPVYLVNVLTNRALSQDIAERTGIEHASPQVLVLRHGKAVASASHGNVSAETVELFLTGTN